MNKQINGLLAATNIMRLLHADARVRWLSEILSVAAHEGETIGYHARELLIRQPTVSQDMASLGRRIPNSKRKSQSYGLGLVRMKHRAGDRRVSEVYLTPKGRDLVKMMIDKLGE